MTGRERVNAIFAWEKPDRIPACESLWSEALARWKTEGYPQDADPVDYFDYEIRTIGGLDQSMQFPTEKISEDDQYVIERNPNRVLLKRHKSESGHTPLWLEHPIKNRADWNNYRERFAMNDNRLDKNVLDNWRKHRDTGRFICLGTTEPYETFWPIFGQVNIFTAMMDDLELVKDVFNTSADLIIAILERYVSKGVQFDGVWFYGDVGYRNGTLFSPDVYDAALAQPHRRICSYVHDLGKPVILHSCGKIKSFISRFIDAGFDAIQPLEAKCDQDVRDLRARHGKDIVLFGNMDVRKLSGTHADVKEEVLGKLEAVAHDSGYIFHSDHSVPPTVSFENYQYALQLARNFVP